MFSRRDIPGREVGLSIQFAFVYISTCLQYHVAMGRDRSKITHKVTIKRVNIINPT